MGEESELTAEQVLAVPVGPGDKTKLGEAQTVLRDMLSDGPLAWSDVQKEAQKAGITESTLKRAKTVLGVKPKRRVSAVGWIWTLPNGRSSSPADDLLRENATPASAKTDEKSTKRIIPPEEDHPTGTRDDDPLRERDPW